VTELPPDWASWRDRFDVAGYDERWRAMAAAGKDPHGEAAFVQALRPASVLDAGCGTGRVGIELARRGIEVVGMDADPDMIVAARAKAPRLTWVVADLAELELGRRFDLVLLAGNVVPYIAAESRAAAIAACARHLEPGRRLVSGFALRDGWPTLADYDGWCSAAGLALAERFGTWDREPLAEKPRYAVSVHVNGPPGS
jgi:SAM-dependent methyltransferase